LSGGRGGANARIGAAGATGAVDDADEVAADPDTIGVGGAAICVIILGGRTTDATGAFWIIRGNDAISFLTAASEPGGRRDGVDVVARASGPDGSARTDSLYGDETGASGRGLPKRKTAAMMTPITISMYFTIPPPYHIKTPRVNAGRFRVFQKSPIPRARRIDRDGRLDAAYAIQRLYVCRVARG